jgi:hypothetical protein
MCVGDCKTGGAVSHEQVAFAAAGLFFVSRRARVHHLLLNGTAVLLLPAVAVAVAMLYSLLFHL